MKADQCRGVFCHSEINTIRSKCSTRWRGILLLIPFVSALGCGGTSGPATIPVKGVVLYDGKPLDFGSVMFSPADPQSGHPAQGKILEDGTFTLSTFEPDDGVLEGDYLVSVVSTIKGTELMERDKGTGIGAKSAIPEKYNSPKTSGLNVSVKSGDASNEVTLELSGS